MNIFDGQWRSYIESTDNSHALKSHGSFSFAVGTSGSLTGSVHNGTALDGDVDLVSQSIEITETDPAGNHIRYRGSVVFHQEVGPQSRTIACGTLTVNPQNVDAQEEGIWVITKP